MDVINLHGMNDPRELTEEEIIDIISVVPMLKSASSEVGTFNRESMLKTLRDQLKEIVVTPLGIQDFKNELVRQFNEALIKPGSVVGVTAAEALGQPITQMALNSFHQSGSSKNVTYGVDRIRELINASKELKTTSCSIFFKNQNLSFDDIITKVRPVLTEINVKDLVKGIPDIESTDNMDIPYWYEPYRVLIRDDFKSSSILRLDIDTDLMYAYKITMADIARVVEADQSVICVFSPLNIGKIHLYPVERAVTSKIKLEGVIDSKNAPMIFLWEAVIPALDTMKISGVAGIKQVYPVEAPVWQIVKEEQKSNSIERGYFLIINEVRQKITGISINKLARLCDLVGITVVKVRPNYLAVQTPNGESPTKLVNDAIKKDKEDEKQYEANKRKEGARVIRRPPTEIMTASHLVYADSDGSLFKGNKSTLRTLLANPNIDSTRTYSNNVHEINEVLGIEAARAFLIKEFGDVFSYEGAYLAPRHIVLLVDFMVSLGQLNGITFTGISRQPIGALEKASLEQAMETFKEASGFGELKEVKGTSASIYVGKRALIGTGYSEQFLDKSKYKDIEKEIMTSSDLKLDIGAFKDAIGELNDVISGADIMIAGGAEREMFGDTETNELLEQAGDYETGDLEMFDRPEVEEEDVMFGGDGPWLETSRLNTDLKKVPDARVYEQQKGSIVRAPELVEAAKKLNEAPCLIRSGAPEVSKMNLASLPMIQPLTELPKKETVQKPSRVMFDLESFMK